MEAEAKRRRLIRSAGLTGLLTLAVGAASLGVAAASPDDGAPANPSGSPTTTATTAAAPTSTTLAKAAAAAPHAGTASYPDCISLPGDRALAMTFPAPISTLASNPFWPANSVPLTALSLNASYVAPANSREIATMKITGSFESSDSSVLPSLLRAGQLATNLAEVTIATRSCALGGVDGNELSITLLNLGLTRVSPTAKAGGFGVAAEFEADGWRITSTPSNDWSSWGTKVGVRYSSRGNQRDLQGMYLPQGTPAWPALGKIDQVTGPPACGGLGYPGDTALALSVGKNSAGDASTDYWPKGSIPLSGLERAGVAVDGPGAMASRTPAGTGTLLTSLSTRSKTGLFALAYLQAATLQAGGSTRVFFPTAAMEVTSPTCTRGETAGRWYAMRLAAARVPILRVTLDDVALTFGAELSTSGLKVTVTPGTGESSWGTPRASG